MAIDRLIDIEGILRRKSLFLFGPRQSGKTTLLKGAFPDAIYFDLLDIDVQRALSLNPRLIEERGLGADSTLFIVDEIQKMPELLDEVHRLIEKHKTWRFILTGSSARKLRRKGVNLLGGRAAQLRLHPLTLKELSDENTAYFKVGGLPPVVLSAAPKLELKDYIEVYLSHEIQMEGLTRNVSNFHRFLFFASATNCEQINYTKLGNDAQISPRTVQDYYQVLEDTLVGHRLAPLFGKKRKTVSIDKFYFFDVGVANYLRNRLADTQSPAIFGKIFEHTVFKELLAYTSYNHHEDYQLNYWRTRTQLEVDFVLTGAKTMLAIETKTTRTPTKRDTKHLHVFAEEFPDAKKVLVCQTTTSYDANGIRHLNLKDFVKELWAGQLI